MGYEEWRRINSAVLDGIYNADISGIGSTTPELIELLTKHNAKPENIEFILKYPTNVSDVFMRGAITKVSRIDVNGGEAYYNIGFAVSSVITGYPEYAAEGSAINLSFYPQYWGGAEPQPDELEPGGHYLVRAYYFPTGESSRRINLRMKPLIDGGPLFMELEAGATPDFGLPELAQLEAEMALVRENQHAMDVYSTRDMRMLEDAQESSKNYYLVDGRWIDLDDDAGGNRVCVVNNLFAGARGLSLGDAIKLSFRNLDLHISGYIVDAADRAAWRGYPTYEEEFEIVGLFGSGSGIANTAQYVNSVYIPDSTLPAQYAGSVTLTASFKYAFVLKSSKYREAFIAETKDALAELGFTARFLENGFDNFWESAMQIRWATALDAYAYGAASVLALALAAFLYLRLRRKDNAILRALGSPKGAAVRRMLAPAAAIGIAAVIAGGSLSWGGTLARASETLSSIPGPEGVAVSAELSGLWLAVLSAGLLAVFMLFVILGSVWMARRPVLAQFGRDKR